MDRATRPLGHKSYGTIPHLPGSRQRREDVGLDAGKARICLQRPRDRHDRVIVLEKLDGSNVSVANIGGTIVPLIRAGYPAVAGRYEQHRLFAAWALERVDWFAFLRPGERLCGEWLAQAHGTRYSLPRGPFVAFDIMRNGHERACWAEVVERVGEVGTECIPEQGTGCSEMRAEERGSTDRSEQRSVARVARGAGERVARIPLPACVFDEAGIGCAIEAAMKGVDAANPHGAMEEAEGAVWRVERKGVVDFLAKFVRGGKVDGKYLPEMSGGEAVWNWRPR